MAERVIARLARQAVLDRKDPPYFWVLLDENVLHREVGSAEIVRNRLAYLAGVARRPHVTVQVVPRVGAHVGLQGGFVMAQTADSYTGTNGNCVEVRDAARTVLVRDTKDRDGVSLGFTATAWRRFATSLK